ncbi:hypothetical protein [Flexithrix dorotheae]|uniref:hypothetical protein n=1 Tax=Flexithrix dorotheae TaxID=70993 RepID=UPI000381880F|nr:hypothetical protein [Flexithrix dorotheae]
MRKKKRQKGTQSKRKKYHVLFNQLSIFSTFILVILCWIFNSINTINSSWFLPKEGFRTEVWDTLRVMKYYDGITCSGVGDGAEQPSQWDRYLWLNDYAEEDELLKMMDLEDGNLNGFAFKILMNRNFEGITQLLKDLPQYEGKMVYEECGCSGESYRLTDYMIGKLLWIRIYDENKKLIQPNSEQIEIISEFWGKARVEEALNSPMVLRVGNYYH